LAALTRPYEVGGQAVTVGASVGVGLYPHDAREPGELRRCADLAMYRAKAAGKNTLRLFGEGEPAPAPAPEETRLRGALERGDLSLVYQPQFDATGRRIVAAEALLRWHDAELGPVPPARFIPLAEASGLIVPVGAWVLDGACRQLAAWRSQGWTGRVTVNVSPVQLTQPEFQEEVMRTLRRHGLRGEDLELEITEGAVLEDARAASGHLARLRGIGVRIAVDDFGMGHAALLYLLAFPVHVLKIDRTFVQGATLREHDRSLVQALVTFARALTLEIVAEGVETEEQRALMQGLGVDVVQGYLLDRPQSAGDLTPQLVGAGHVGAGGGE
ncbi:GGDEF domain-containing phosphodiesterase, partial [Deinococcus sp. MIMF12]